METPRIRERFEEQTQTMDDIQQSAVRALANELHRLNQSVLRAVESGLTVELIRSSRCHGGSGSWGDLLIPVIVAKDQSGESTLQ